MSKRPPRQLDFLPALARESLRQRLLDEGETALAQKLSTCGLDVPLTCTCCGSHSTAHSQCKRKWCPSCQPSVAARAKERITPVVARFRWPLHVTLTCRNSPTPDSLKLFRKWFTSFRRRRIWTTRVVGGIAGYEMTQQGRGFHPHAHLLVDCEWLALDTPAPTRHMHPDAVKLLCKRAQSELSRAWANHIKQRHGAVVWVKRVSALDAIAETLKYSVKCNDLLEAVGPIGPMIRAIDSIRCMTTFGSCYKIGKPQKGEGSACKSCGEIGAAMPDAVLDLHTRIRLAGL